MRKLVLALFAAVVAALVFPAVAAAGNQAILSWTAPTTNTDGTAITGAVTYNVYQGTATALATAAVQTGLTATSVTVTAGLTDGATVCWAVTAVAGGIESAQSATACKTFPAGTPNSPAGFTAK